MRKLPKPTNDFQTFYNLCVKGVGNENKRQRLYDYANKVLFESRLYEDNSNNNQLYKTVKHFDIVKQQLTVNYVTNAELTDLYINQMAKKNRPGRSLYDSLMIVPNSRCPFCSVGKVKNLDHFLPKSQLPIFSILPINLVPSCRDCNQDKSDNLFLEEKDQTLHPYFDDVSDVQWLFAEVIEDNPVVIEYRVDISTLNNTSLAKKVVAHFKAYDLANIFSELAAEELDLIYYESRRLFLECNSFELKSHLIQKKESGFKCYKNSWQVALYQSLSRSEWYCNGKFIIDAPVTDDNDNDDNDDNDDNEVKICPICKGKVSFCCPECMTSIAECELCNGSGILTSSDCPNCEGLGLDRD